MDYSHKVGIEKLKSCAVFVHGILLKKVKVEQMSRKAQALLGFPFAEEASAAPVKFGQKFMESDKLLLRRHVN